MDLGHARSSVTNVKSQIAMEKIEQQTLVDAWIALHKLPSDAQQNSHHFWAFERVCELCEESPEECWDIILGILRKDSNAKVLSNLAAGPLEDLLVAHGAMFVEKIEQQAKTDERFRNLLGGVWQNAIPDDIWRRIKAVSGPSW